MGKKLFVKKRCPLQLDGFNAKQDVIYIVKNLNSRIKAILSITVNSTTIGYVFILKIAFFQ